MRAATRAEFDALLECGILAYGFVRLLLAAQPMLVTPVLQVMHRLLTGFLVRQAEQADSGAVTLIQRFCGSLVRAQVKEPRQALQALKMPAISR